EYRFPLTSFAQAAGPVPAGAARTAVLAKGAAHGFTAKRPRRRVGRRAAPERQAAATGRRLLRRSPSSRPPPPPPPAAGRLAAARGSAATGRTGPAAVTRARSRPSAGRGPLPAPPRRPASEIQRRTSPAQEEAVRYRAGGARGSSANRSAP